MTSNFSTVFLIAFALTLSIRLWLKLRHIRYVAAHRETVPAKFAERISLALSERGISPVENDRAVG